MNYIGSKISIIDFIDETIDKFVDSKNSDLVFCDIFSGTATVGKYFKEKGYTIISNDIQYYSYMIAKHFIENNSDITFKKLKTNKIDNVFEYLNTIEGKKGFIYNNYSLAGTKGQEYERQYFSDENALKIDSIRLCIENWKIHNLLNFCN